MPTYELKCEKCKKTFTANQTFEEHDQHTKIKCPKCGGETLSPHPSKFSPNDKYARFRQPAKA